MGAPSPRRPEPSPAQRRACAPSAPCPWQQRSGCWPLPAGRSPLRRWPGWQPRWPPAAAAPARWSQAAAAEHAGRGEEGGQQEGVGHIGRIGRCTAGGSPGSSCSTQQQQPHVRVTPTWASSSKERSSRRCRSSATAASCTSRPAACRKKERMESSRSGGPPPRKRAGWACGGGQLGAETSSRESAGSGKKHVCAWQGGPQPAAAAAAHLSIGLRQLALQLPAALQGRVQLLLQRRRRRLLLPQRPLHLLLLAANLLGEPRGRPPCIAHLQAET